MDLEKYIRKIPHFPKKGILYYDITGVLAQPEAFSWAIQEMLRLYEGEEFSAVAGIESRGFIFASIFAQQRGIPLILIRKAGKLPGVTLKKAYQLEYGKAEIEVHLADVPRSGKVLLVDDLIATGGTLRAAYELLTEAGAEVEHAFGMIGLPFLGFAESLPQVKLKTLVDYHSEEVD